MISYSFLLILSVKLNHALALKKTIQNRSIVFSLCYKCVTFSSFFFFFFFFFYSPFFGEDVHFEVPRDFRTLCFYLFDTDLIGKDTVLGKVS